MDLIKYIIESIFRALSLGAPTFLILISIITAKKFKEIAYTYIGLLGTVVYSWFNSKDKMYIYSQMIVFLVYLVLIVLLYIKVYRKNYEGDQNEEKE